MATSAVSVDRPEEQLYPELEPAYYISNILRLFVEGLKGRRETQILDIGPVCGENINFLAQRVKRLYICDMFHRLDRHRHKGLPPSQAWRHLDYPPQSFDGILLWDLTERLDDQEAGRLVELCHSLVKPGGMVAVFVLGEKASPSLVNTFVIGDDFRVYLRPQSHLALPLRSRQNRDVLAMMAPFRPVKSYIYRIGLEEFLFRHE